MYLKDRLRAENATVTAPVAPNLRVAGVVVILTILGACACLVALLFHGLRFALLLMSAETILLFGILWTLSRLPPSSGLPKTVPRHRPGN